MMANMKYASTSCCLVSIYVNSCWVGKIVSLRLEMMTKKEERRDEDGRPTDQQATSNKQQVSNKQATSNQKQPKHTV